MGFAGVGRFTPILFLNRIQLIGHDHYFKELLKTQGYHAWLEGFLQNEFANSAKLAGQDGILYVNSKVCILGYQGWGFQHPDHCERPPFQDGEYGWQWVAWGYDGAGFGTGDCLLGVRERVNGMRSIPGIYRSGNLNSNVDYDHYWSMHTGGAY